MGIRQKLTRLLLIVVLTAAWGTTSEASDVIVRSVPPGATAKLDGELVVLGVTPVRFKQPLFGDYRLTVSMPGYESRSQWLTVHPDESLVLESVLSRKTGLKAALRSVLIPGWGQLYSEHKSKAMVFAGLTLASATAFLIADLRFDNKYDDYKVAKDRYYAATTIADRQRLWPVMEEAQRTAYDAEDVRRVTVGVVGVVYALNVLDALFFPAHVSTGIDVKGLSLAPVGLDGRPGLQISTRF